MVHELALLLGTDHAFPELELDGVFCSNNPKALVEDVVNKLSTSMIVLDVCVQNKQFCESVISGKQDGMLFIQSDDSVTESTSNPQNPFRIQERR